jgi:GDSL-like Lipase/Acylhydrolase family
MNNSILRQKKNLIAPDDVRLSYSDCGSVNFINGVARFSRPGPENHHAGYTYDNPGARLRLRTDATNIEAKFRYNELHISKTARNSVGACLIDGIQVRTFGTEQQEIKRIPEDIDVELKSPLKGFHTYEFVMPYCDSIDILGVYVPDEANFETPEPRPEIRCAFYGDSVTHGATASNITGTYPYLVAKEKGFQMVNLGIGGRVISGHDGKLLAAVKCDLAVIHIGVNNWQSGISLEQTKEDMLTFLHEFRKCQSNTPLYVITPLWVSLTWGVKKHPLEEYRRVIQEAVEKSCNTNTKLINGLRLIDHDEIYFDKVLVHPNDAGFKMMAERLAEKL